MGLLWGGAPTPSTHRGHILQPLQDGGLLWSFIPGTAHVWWCTWTQQHVYVHTVLRMMPCAMLESPDVSLLQEQEQNAAESKGDVFWGANCPNSGH